MKTGKRSKLSAKERLVVALDGDSLVRAQELVELLGDEVVNFEIGLELFTACGPAVIDEIRKAGCRAFLDLKYHDIPSTVAKAVVAAARMGVSLMNVHASGGQRMMRKAREALDKIEGERPLLIAATVLTSMSTLGDVGIQFEVREQVMRLAKLALEAGLDGVNASPLEISNIRQVCGNNFLIVTPGIRMAGDDADDQLRIGGPQQAIAAGADYLVVGRPITRARDPLSVVRNMIREMQG